MTILEEIYAMFPRKRGKTQGMAKLKKISRNGECSKTLELVMRAVQNYRDECVGRDHQFILHFSTFMNRWEDYLEEDRQEDPFVLPEVDLDGNYV